MAIPIVYNIRNLRLRLGATLMTAFGISLTVATAVFVAALLNGLHEAFVATGDPLNVVVMRQGAQVELQSSVDRDALQVIKFLPGIAKNQKDEPLVSGEMVLAIVLSRRDDTSEANVVLRGMMQSGVQMRPKVKLLQGRWFIPGQHEVVVSNSVRNRFRNADLDQNLRFGKGTWNVVGVFDAGQTAFSSEIWADVNQMSSDFGRDAFMSVLVRAVDAVSAEALKNRMNDDQRLKLQGILEPDYFAEQTRSGTPLQIIGTVVAIIMGIGSCFAAMNTMYAAVVFRAREIATLRVLGFARRNILISFSIESILISLLGALIGIVVMLPLSGVTTGTNNGLTFSEMIFRIRIDFAVVLMAFAFAVTMGLIGGIAPAWHAARRNIVECIRG